MASHQSGCLTSSRGLEFVSAAFGNPPLVQVLEGVVEARVINDGSVAEVDGQLEPAIDI